MNSDEVESILEGLMDFRYESVFPGSFSVFLSENNS